MKNKIIVTLLFITNLVGCSVVDDEQGKTDNRVNSQENQTNREEKNKEEDLPAKEKKEDPPKKKRDQEICEARKGGALQSIYGQKVTSFTPGTGAGFGADQMPDVVLGPPKGGGKYAGSLDVLSLGGGGSIVIDLGKLVCDIKGPELFVFENPFVNKKNGKVFAELGRVSVSLDGESWTAFPCSPNSDETSWKECAGKSPVLSYDPARQLLDPHKTGGDAFDLATIGVTAFQYVKIEDLSDTGGAPTAGFDLDAVGANILVPSK